MLGVDFGVEWILDIHLVGLNAFLVRIFFFLLLAKAMYGLTYFFFPFCDLMLQMVYPCCY